MPLLKLHLTNPFNFWSPSLIQNVYIFSMIALLSILFILAAWFIISYLKRFYGERPVPKEWKIFWWAFVFYTLHEVLEFIGIYQWMLGKVFFILLTTSEIASVILLTWGCYLLVKTYVLKR